LACYETASPRIVKLTFRQPFSYQLYIIQYGKMVDILKGNLTIKSIYLLYHPAC